jgi:hypothetical protein
MTQGSGERQRSPGLESSRSSPNSSLLDYVRHAQMAAQEQRTTARIRELTQDQGLSNYGLSESPVRAWGRNTADASLDSTPTAVSVGSWNSGYHEGGMSNVVPVTVVRRNITQRRSRGWEMDNGSTAPDPSILSRRPRSRSKDRRYSIEAEGIAVVGCERQDWRSASAANRPTFIAPDFKDLDVGLQSSSRQNVKSEEGKFRRESNSPKKTDSTTTPDKFVRGSNSAVLPESPSAQMDQIAPFLRDYIPSEETDPELHRVLTQHWYDRQEVVRGLGDALGSDDPIKYNMLVNQIALINKAMFPALNKKETHRKGVGTVSLPERDDDGVSSSSSSDHSFLRSEPKYRQVDSLPLEDFQSPSRPSKKSYKEISATVFTIQSVFTGLSMIKCH